MNTTYLISFQSLHLYCVAYPYLNFCSSVTLIYIWFICHRLLNKMEANTIHLLSILSICTISYYFCSSPLPISPVTHIYIYIFPLFVLWMLITYLLWINFLDSRPLKFPSYFLNFIIVYRFSKETNTLYFCLFPVAVYLIFRLYFGFLFYMNNKIFSSKRNRLCKSWIFIF
jgi:hypothetical protein